MKKLYLNTILKSFGYAILTIVFINITYLVLELINQPALEEFSLRFRHGQFILNNKVLGINIFDYKYLLGFTLLSLVFFLFINRKRAK